MLRHKIFLLYVTSTFDRYEYVYQYWIKISVTTESLYEKCTAKHFFQVFLEQWIGKIALCKNISLSCPPFLSIVYKSPFIHFIASLGGSKNWIHHSQASKWHVNNIWVCRCERFFFCFLFKTKLFATLIMCKYTF